MLTGKGGISILIPMHELVINFSVGSGDKPLISDSNTI